MNFDLLLLKVSRWKGDWWGIHVFHVNLDTQARSLFSFMYYEWTHEIEIDILFIRLPPIFLRRKR